MIKIMMLMALGCAWAWPQADVMKQDGSLLSVQVVLGEPMKIFVVGKEEGKLDLSKLKLTVRRLAPAADIPVTRIDNHFILTPPPGSPAPTDIEVTTKLKNKTETYQFKIDQSSILDLETKKIMEQFLTELTALKKYFVSEAKFSDPKNNFEIASRLKSFANLAKQSRHDPTLRQQNFKFSRDILEKHIVNTERIFRMGNQSYARWQLASTASICMSCHTQMPTSNRQLQDFEDTKSFASTFDQAEFLFTTHAFDKAMALYDKVIDQYPKNKFSIDDVQTSLERQVAYYSRILRDPQEAIKKMKGHRANQKLPDSLKTNISAWISQFELWEKNVSINPQTATDKQILEFARENIQTQWTLDMMETGNPSLVNYLRISGLLYEYLKFHSDSKVVPEILYWLSICDRSISHTFFYSLADLYLRECMIRYPESQIAKKCYTEYEAEMILGYTGSSGTHLPDEVKKELAQLKKHVDSGGKIELRDY